MSRMREPTEPRRSDRYVEYTKGPTAPNEKLCEICQEDIEPAEPTIKHKECGQCYHTPCLEKWALADYDRDAKPCPRCRGYLGPQMEELMELHGPSVGRRTPSPPPTMNELEDMEPTSVRTGNYNGHESRRNRSLVRRAHDYIRFGSDGTPDEAARLLEQLDPPSRSGGSNDDRTRSSGHAGRERNQNHRQQSYRQPSNLPGDSARPSRRRTTRAGGRAHDYSMSQLAGQAAMHRAESNAAVPEGSQGIALDPGNYEPSRSQHRGNLPREPMMWRASPPYEPSSSPKSTTWTSSSPPYEPSSSPESTTWMPSSPPYEGPSRYHSRNTSPRQGQNRTTSSRHAQNRTTSTRQVQGRTTSTRQGPGRPTLSRFATISGSGPGYSNDRDGRYGADDSDDSDDSDVPDIWSRGPPGRRLGGRHERCDYDDSSGSDDFDSFLETLSDRRSRSHHSSTSLRNRISNRMASYRRPP